MFMALLISDKKWKQRKVVHRVVNVVYPNNKMLSINEKEWSTDNATMRMNLENTTLS